MPYAVRTNLQCFCGIGGGLVMLPPIPNLPACNVLLGAVLCLQSVWLIMTQAVPCCVHALCQSALACCEHAMVQA